MPVPLDRCDACTVYEGTVHFELGSLTFILCHSCLERTRGRLKTLFKRSLTERKEAKKNCVQT